MIIELVRESKQRNPFLVAYKINGDKKDRVCVVTDLVEKNEQIMEYDFGDRKEKLYFSLSSPKGKELQKQVSALQRMNAYFILDDADNSIGKIFVKSNKLKKHLLITYYSTIIEYRGKEYEAWEIGFGDKGQYYVVFEGGALVAVMEHNYAEAFGDAVYTLYSEKDDAEELLFIASYWYLNREYTYSVQRADTSTYQMVTPYKEIKEKFNPSFIPRIKARDGITD